MQSWIMALVLAGCALACGCQTTVEGFVLPCYNADPSTGLMTGECSMVLVPKKGPNAYELWITEECDFVGMAEPSRFTHSLLRPDDRFPDPQTIYRARGKVARGEGLKLDLPSLGPRTVVQLHINRLEAVQRVGPPR